jgi:hypothetical protein
VLGNAHFTLSGAFLFFLSPFCFFLCLFIPVLCFSCSSLNAPVLLLPHCPFTGITTMR